MRDASGDNPVYPAWTVGAGLARAYARGLRDVPAMAALILGVACLGFGAMAKAAGLSFAQATLATVIVWALPGQVMLVDQMVRGAPLIVAAVAVSVTAIRFLPLTVALMPIVRGPETRGWVEFAVAHFVAITMWLEAMRRLPSLPQPLRVPYYFGMATALVGVSALSTAAGFLMASGMPAVIAAALMLLSPLYFLIALIAASRAAPERLAIIAGLTLAPPLYLLTPQLDLLLAGLVGGTLAYGVDRVLRKRRATPQEPEI